jgi:hypothetical protein
MPSDPMAIRFIGLRGSRWTDQFRFVCLIERKIPRLGGNVTRVFRGIAGRAPRLRQDGEQVPVHVTDPAVTSSPALLARRAQT